jgi:hypothetical protein
MKLSWWLCPGIRETSQMRIVRDLIPDLSPDETDGSLALPEWAQAARLVADGVNGYGPGLLDAGVPREMDRC